MKKFVRPPARCRVCNETGHEARGWPEPGCPHSLPPNVRWRARCGPCDQAVDTTSHAEYRAFFAAHPHGRDPRAQAHRIHMERPTTPA